MSRVFSPEDLISFAEDLRLSGYNIGTQQFIAAQHLLVMLAAHANLPPNPRELKTWLAPVLCSSAKEQEVFYDLFERWLEQHSFGPPDSASPTPPEARAHGPSLAARLLRALYWLGRPKRMLVAAALAVAFVLAGLFLLLRPHTLNGRVVDESSQPVQDALISFARKTARSDAGGQFSLRLSLSSFPNTLTVKHPSYVGANRDLKTMPEGAVSVTLRKAVVTQQSSGLTEVTVPLSIIRLLPAPAADRWLSWLVPLSPLLILAAWLLWGARRRIYLEKMQSGQRPLLERVVVRGAPSLLFRSPTFRRSVQELRRHRRRDAPELDPYQTVQSTVARGGLYTPVVGTRTVSPEYLVLIDRGSLHDQQARLEDEIVKRLKEESVFVDHYYFSDDPRLCHDGTQTKRALRLSELAALHHDHHLLIFSDGASFINPLTGRPELWVERLSAWRGCTLLTAERRAHWGYCEATLLDQGILVLPLSRDGLAELAETVNTDNPPAGHRDDGRAAPYPELLRLSPKRWLERHEPRPEVTRRLCDQLKAYLGGDGYAWLGACAVYPVPQWELTLYLGHSLFGAREGLEEELLPLVRLPWLRRGSIPDWLRLVLIADLSPERERAVRRALQELLISLVEHPAEGFVIDFSRSEMSRRREASAPASGLLRWARLFKYESLLRALFRAESPNGPLRDYIFLGFMSRRRPGRLAVGLPRTLHGLLFPHGHSALGLRPVAACALAALLALLGWYWVASRDVPEPASEEAANVKESSSSQVVFISSELTWILRGTTAVSLNENSPVGGYGLSGYLKALEPSLANVDAVVCVGMASSEGGSSGINEELANRRELTLVGGVRGLNLKPGTRIYGLNLGFYRGGKLSNSYAEQRKVIVIGIRNAGPDVDLKAVLRNALSGQPSSPLDVDNYSRFTLTDYTQSGVVP